MINIEKATINNFDGFIEVFREFEEFNRQNAKWKFRKFSKDVFPFSLYKEILLDPNRILLLARNENEIVGYILGEIMETILSSIFNDRKWMEVDDLCVKQAYKKQGIGKLLMQNLEEIAKSNEISELELKVRDFNKVAIEFYEKLGYDIYSHKMRKEI